MQRNARQYATRVTALALITMAEPYLHGCERDELICPAMDCLDGSRVDVRLGEYDAEFLAVEVTVDGKTIQCSAPTLMTLGTCSSPDVEVAPETTYTCSSVDTREETCETSGAFAQGVIVRGHPAEFTIVRNSSNGVTWSRTFRPIYNVQLPNGPECGATCRSAEMLWELR
jgi:hypothetical protein